MLNTFIGIGAVGSALVGVVALILGLLAFFGGDFSAAGALLIAAALGFGMLANAVLGK